MDIDDFVKNFNDVSRENRFRVSGDKAIPPYPLEALVQSVSLPGIMVHTGLWRDVGHSIKYPNNVDFNELQISFYDTSDQKIQKFYVNWVGDMYNGREFKYKNQYVHDLYVHKLNRRNEEVIKYKAVNAFPIAISDVNLNTGGQNSPSIVTITFSYDQWQIG